MPEIIRGKERPLLESFQFNYENIKTNKPYML